MEFHPYPRMLYKNPGTEDQVYLIVPDEEGEAAARGEGWHGYDETPGAADAPKKRGRKPKAED